MLLPKSLKSVGGLPSEPPKPDEKPPLGDTLVIPVSPPKDADVTLKAEGIPPDVKPPPPPPRG